MSRLIHHIRQVVADSGITVFGCTLWSQIPGDTAEYVCDIYSVRTFGRSMVGQPSIITKCMGRPVWLHNRASLARDEPSRMILAMTYYTLSV